MLIVLLFFSLFRMLQGVPLSTPATALADSFSNLILRETDSSHFSQRTVNDIVISCFATIFACTWSAIHPNIPAPMDCWWTRFKRQVVTMACALVAPELITVWALRQRLAAKEIMDEYNKEVLGALDTENSILNTIKLIPNIIKGLFHDSPIPTSSEKGPQWTLTHGFFLQMGGFMLSDRGKPLHTLLCSTQTDPEEKQIPDDEQLIYNIKNGIINAPRTMEADIQDRSKGDAISKLFIILQTTWFIAQCIARWTQHLPVTELEVVTLGFAMLNGITYALWWNKPQNVGRPVFLECKARQSVSENSLEYTNAAIPTIPNSSDEGPIPAALDTDSGSISLHSVPRHKSWIWKELQRAMEGESNWMILIFGPFALVGVFVRPLVKLMSSSSDRKDRRVPMFYAGSADDYTAFTINIPLTAVFFGSIHLIPSWFLDFSSRQEMWLWRISAVIITAVPALLPISKIIADTIHDDVILEIIFDLFAYIGVILYVYPVARIILLILSLTSLRSLPPAALQTIEWTTFIPHL